MEDSKITCDDVITCETPEYRKLAATMQNIMRITDKLMKKVRPSLLSVRYFTTEQVMEHFHISRRALQNYRDKGLIPYTSIGGNILYPEAKIKHPEVLSILRSSSAQQGAIISGM